MKNPRFDLHDLPPFPIVIFVMIGTCFCVWLEARSYGFNQAVDVFTGGDGSYYCEPLIYKNGKF